LPSGTARADEAAQCRANAGTFLTGNVTQGPTFAPGHLHKGIELSHTHLTLLSDQDGRSYHVAIDNVFATGYDAARESVPAPLSTIRTGDRLELCGKLFTRGGLGIDWVHTNCGNRPSTAQLIVAVALVLLYISIVLCLFYAIETARSPDQSFLLNTVKVSATFIGLLATVFAVFGTICAWAYKVGSARLGVVDLFACEISTLCRVATVLDTVGRFMDRIKLAEKTNSESIFPPAELKPEAAKSDEQASNNRMNSPLAMQFTSLENYFPVFEGNTRDLQSLEARVVINITSFYTMRERRLLLRWKTYQNLVADLGSRIKEGVERAKAAHVTATEVRYSQTELSIEALTLELWEGAEKLWPDLELLYQKLEAIIPKPNAA
jgi:hypothetical protein